MSWKVQQYLTTPCKLESDLHRLQLSKWRCRWHLHTLANIAMHDKVLCIRPKVVCASLVRKSTVNRRHSNRRIKQHSINRGQTGSAGDHRTSTVGSLLELFIWYASPENGHVSLRSPLTEWSLHPFRDVTTRTYFLLARIWSHRWTRRCGTKNSKNIRIYRQPIPNHLQSN